MMLNTTGAVTNDSKPEIVPNGSVFILHQTKIKTSKQKINVFVF